MVFGAFPLQKNDDPGICPMPVALYPIPVGYRFYGLSQAGASKTTVWVNRASGASTGYRDLFNP